jgi:hypothetical protein
MKILREKTPEFWEQAWQEAHKYSLHARKRRELDQLDYWNSMAKFFAIPWKPAITTTLSWSNS